MSVNDALQFFRSIYLGDRACAGLRIDSTRDEVRVVIDEISRVRSADGRWNYYNDENIINGCIVFGNVQSVSFNMTGLLPNDYVELLGVREASGGLQFQLELGCVGADALTRSFVLEVTASDVYLEDPNRPGAKIR